MMISPAYAYEKAPDQEHFLGVQQTRELFGEAFADGRRKKLAAEPQPAVPRLPRGQGRIRLHRLGDPELLAVRLAAPLLPDGRRLHGDLQRADRDDRLEQVRARPRPALRELHGPLRLRADRGAADDPLAAPVAARARRLARHARGSAGASRRSRSAASRRGCPARSGPRRAAPGCRARAPSGPRPPAG